MLNHFNEFINTKYKYFDRGKVFILILSWIYFIQVQNKILIKK